MSITGAEPTESEDEAQTGGADYENPETAEQLRGALSEQKQEREEELTAAERKKRKVMGAIAEKTVTVRIDGDWRAKFTRIMGDEEQWFREIYRKEQQGELTEEEDDEAEERINDILLDHARSDWIDHEFIVSLPSAVKLDTFQDIVQGGEESEEGNR